MNLILFKINKPIRNLKYRVMFFLFFAFLSAGNRAQEPGFKNLTLEDAVNMALENNPQSTNAELELVKAKKFVTREHNFSPTEFSYQYGQINSPENDRYMEINQHFGSLLYHIGLVKSAQSYLSFKTTESEIAKKELIIKVKSAYYYLVYLNECIKIAEEEKKLFADLSRISVLKYEKGETDLLQKRIDFTRQAEITLKVNELYDDFAIAQNKLKQLMMNNEDFILITSELQLYMVDKASPDSGYNGRLLLASQEQYLDYLNSLIKAEKSKFFPEISAGYFNQDMGEYKGLDGWQIGLDFPLLFFSQKAIIDEYKAESEIVERNIEYKKFEIEKSIENLIIELNRYFKQYIYYKDFELVQADEMSKAYTMQFTKEEIEYPEYVEGMSAALKIMTEYLEIINAYNQTAIQLEFYSN